MKKEKTTVRSQEATNIWCLVVDEDIQQVDFQIHTDLLSGSLDWLLKDPNGFIREEGLAPSGQKVDKNYTYEKLEPGNWRLEFRLHNVTGDFDAHWIVQRDGEANLLGETHVHKYIGPRRAFDIS
jgi:hypothetical protein